jgi:signal transduction histidine kinase
VSHKTEPQRRPPHVRAEDVLGQLRALAERTGGIAHDLNNMLGTMIGYGALVLDDLPEDDPNRAFLEKVVEAGAEATQLVADLLDEARAETARPNGTILPKAA